MINVEEEHTRNAYLEEEGQREVEEHSAVDREQVIKKRLKTISDSVPFHSGFLQKLMEKSIMAEKKDGVTIFRFVEKCETTANRDCEGETMPDNERETMQDNEREHSSDVENSNDKAVPDSSENKFPDALSLENCTDHTIITSDFKENVKNPEATIEIDSDESSTNHIAKEIERPFELGLLNMQYSFHSNFYTMLFEAVRRLDEATIRNVDVLRVMPDNFNALWNKVKLMIAMADVSGNCIDERAEEILDQLEQTISHNRKQMLVAKAEIAGMYTYLYITSDTLIRCIQLYEEVLAETCVLNQNKCTETAPENLADFWKYDLVSTYAMLTNANKKLLANYGYSHGEVLSRLEELVLAVDSSDHIANKLKAQTWVNLANTFEHFRQNYDTKNFREDVCMGLSLEDLFANAREYDPDNPVILMRSGRELRQRAKSAQDLEEAIGLLNRALNGENRPIERVQDIIHHQIGLAYRALWMHTEHPVCEKIIENTYKFPRNKPLGCRVIKAPNHPLDPSRIPAPYRKPLRSAFRMILIPIAHDPDHPYLLESIRCFEKANRLDNDDDSYALFLLDIARTYSNMRNVEKAREYFQKTLNNSCSDSVSVDFVGVSLFENLAHFEECEMIRKAFVNFESRLTPDTHQNVESDSLPENFVDDFLFKHVAHFEECEMIREAFSNSESEKVKSLYRESIRFSTISKIKTIVAFHYILRILYKQLTLSADKPLPEMDQMILQNEYFLIYMAVHEAKENYGMVKAFATDDFRIALMWRLIEMFNHRNHQYDAAAAFTYLSIIIMANKLTAEVKGIDLTATGKKRMLIQSAERVAQQRVAVAEIRYLLPEYKELCDLQDTHKENVSLGSEPLTDQEIKKLDIINNIIQPEFNPGYLRYREQC